MVIPIYDIKYMKLSKPCQLDILIYNLFSFLYFINFVKNLFNFLQRFHKIEEKLTRMKTKLPFQISSFYLLTSKTSNYNKYLIF